jgi:hypothetical protein|tara:strand:+ start:427 stop:717 length:291 start_codon:yes stop_codon:yes gene_type:complete
MLGLNELFKKKYKKKKSIHQIDFVITELEVKIQSYHNPFGMMASFIFIDEKPSFPKVRNTLFQLNKTQEAYVLEHNYTFREITPTTDLTGLDIIRH